VARIKIGTGWTLHRESHLPSWGPSGEEGQNKWHSPAALPPSPRLKRPPPVARPDGFVVLSCLFTALPKIPPSSHWDLALSIPSASRRPAPAIPNQTSMGFVSLRFSSVYRVEIFGTTPMKALCRWTVMDELQGFHGPKSDRKTGTQKPLLLKFKMAHRTPASTGKVKHKITFRKGIQGTETAKGVPCRIHYQLTRILLRPPGWAACESGAARPYS